MTFISYAQNFEDVMLWRALKHIECGFYIDVGANDPEVDSVTKAFYDHGWRGINIEPIPAWFKKLEENRARDINLQLAVGSKNGQVVIYDFRETGLSTTDKATAQRHEVEQGWKNVELTVPVETLTEICQRVHVTPIHFLKIDVEGAEKEVLLGIDFSVIRPWIILVESMLPCSQVESYAQWESILLDSGYEYVYFDGLNRYYIAHEHSEIKANFLTPPNIFDGFMLSGLANQSFYKHVEARAKRAEAASNLDLMQLHAIYASTSWRITAPLRKLVDAKRAFLPSPKVAKSALKTKIKLLLAHAKLYVIRRPKLQRGVMHVLAKFPNLKARLKQASFSRYSEKITKPSIPVELASLTPRARQIYSDLKTAIEQNQKENR